MIPTLLSTTEEGIWVFDKPAGFATHPTHDPELPDLITWAKAQGAPPSLAPIHRLDRETSGLLLCASDPALLASAGRWFAEHAIQKSYLALVFGHPRPTGEINTQLSDGRRGKPLPAKTRYHCVEALARLSLLEVAPQTGRKHQIRRHLQGIGHAIVGDTRYPPRPAKRVPGFPGRLWLHAGALRLPDGRTLHAPLPEALEAHLALLRALDAAPAALDAAPAAPDSDDSALT